MKAAIEEAVEDLCWEAEQVPKGKSKQGPAISKADNKQTKTQPPKRRTITPADIELREMPDS